MSQYRFATPPVVNPERSAVADQGVPIRVLGVDYELLERIPPNG
jgi:hypothetical protein